MLRFADLSKMAQKQNGGRSRSRLLLFYNRQLHDFTFTIYKALSRIIYLFIYFKSAELVFGEILFLYRTNNGIVGCTGKLEQFFSPSRNPLLA